VQHGGDAAVIGQQHPRKVARKAGGDGAGDTIAQCPQQTVGIGRWILPGRGRNGQTDLGYGGFGRRGGDSSLDDDDALGVAARALGDTNRQRTGHGHQAGQTKARLQFSRRQVMPFAGIGLADIASEYLHAALAAGTLSCAE